MVTLEAIVLGIVQGLTEFIPISSSAHLIIIPWLFGWNDPALTSLTFDVALHMGTLLAVLVFFAKDWWRLIRAWVASITEWKIGQNVDRRKAWFLVIATIPGAIFGVLGESKIEALFHQPGVPIQPLAMIIMAVIITIFGLALYLADRLLWHVRELDQMTFKDTLWIGLAQALAIFPGVSRSGSTIMTGLALGFKRDDAARFSFLLSAPIIAGAGLKSLLEVFGQLHAGTLSSSELLIFPIGFIFAAISGLLCIKYLLRYLQKHSLNVFVFYRWALALLIVLVVVLRGA
jgi:undecaprenyl-diphosphatase